MRIRCSKGLRISAFHGHFFIRSTDLLALPQARSLLSYTARLHLLQQAGQACCSCSWSLFARCIQSVIASTHTASTRHHEVS